MFNFDKGLVAHQEPFLKIDPKWERFWILQASI
jgi:hypothetical protein